MHRDIKPDNIMIRSNDNFNHICVTDFGFAKFFDLDKKEEEDFCGT